MGHHACSACLLPTLSPAVLGGAWALLTIVPMTGVKKVGDIPKNNPEGRSPAGNRRPMPGPERELVMAKLLR